MCLGFVTGFGSFIAVRAILGMAEGGLLPGMVLYLSGMYNRGELALRMGIFYTAASLSGAFGGMLSYSTNKNIKNVADKKVKVYLHEDSLQLVQEAGWRVGDGFSSSKDSL